MQTSQDELSEWEVELERVKELGRLASTRDQLVKVDIPELQTQLKDKEAKLPDVTIKANEVGSVSSSPSSHTNCILVIEASCEPEARNRKD